MAWVNLVSEQDATGLVKEIYSRSKRGPVQAEIVKVFSLRPELMDIRVRIGDRMTFGGSGLGRYREELISVSISAVCKCRF